MLTHTLKIHDIYFDAIKYGHKSFVIRKNDRFFQMGDTVVLQRFSPANEKYTTPDGSLSAWTNEADTLIFTVGAVLQGGQFGIEPGYCVFSLISFQAA